MKSFGQTEKSFVIFYFQFRNLKKFLSLEIPPQNYLSSEVLLLNTQLTLSNSIFKVEMDIHHKGAYRIIERRLIEFLVDGILNLIENGSVLISRTSN